MQGQRLPDVEFDEQPWDAPPGSYWRCLADGQPLDCGDNAHERGNLTRGVWGIVTPNGLFGSLRLHTVREEEDGTISIRPGDGSSNSVLVTEHRPDGDITWHGYVEHGVWSEC